MSTFVYLPDFPAVKKSKPAVTKISFGDGYESRVSMGMNANLRSWDLTFRNRLATENDAIEDFLTARGATESFDWTEPFTSEAIKVVCRDWTRSHDHFNISSITATFEEVAEP